MTRDDTRVRINLVSQAAQTMFGSTPGLTRVEGSRIAYEGTREVVAGIARRAEVIAQDPRSTDRARGAARAVARHCRHVLRREAGHAAG